MIRLEPRLKPAPVMVYLSPIFAIALTLASAIAIFAALGQEPYGALYAYFVQPISSIAGLAELGVKATPLVIIAMGLAIGFRANVWNLGAEGQFTLGAIFGAGVALYFHDSDSVFVLPGTIFAGIAGGRRL